MTGRQAQTTPTQGSTVDQIITSTLSPGMSRLILASTNSLRRGVVGKLTGRIHSFANALQIVKPHDTGDADEPSQEKEPAHADFLLPVQSQAPHNRYRHGQDQDIRQQIGDVREPEERHHVDAMPSRDGAVPEIRSRGALECDAKALDDADPDAGDAERQMARTPPGSCVLPGEQAAVEEQDGQLDEDHRGGHQELEGVCDLRGNLESVGEYGTIRTWDRTHFDVFLGAPYADSHQVLPSSQGDT